MSTTSEAKDQDADLLATYREGYFDWWKSDEAKTERYSGRPRRDHAAGLRAVAAAAWSEAARTLMGKGGAETTAFLNPYREPSANALVVPPQDQD